MLIIWKKAHEDVQVRPKRLIGVTRPLLIHFSLEDGNKFVILVENRRPPTLQWQPCLIPQPLTRKVGGRVTERFLDK